MNPVVVQKVEVVKTLGPKRTIVVADQIDMIDFINPVVLVTIFLILCFSSLKLFDFDFDSFFLHVTLMAYLFDLFLLFLFDCFIFVSKELVEEPRSELQILVMCSRFDFSHFWIKLSFFSLSNLMFFVSSVVSRL